MTKAMEATGSYVQPFNAALIERGLDYQEAHRVWRFFFAQWFYHMAQYQASSGEQRRALDTAFLIVYASGLGRLFWDNFSPDGRPLPVRSSFVDHVNRLIAEADTEVQQ